MSAPPVSIREEFFLRRHLLVPLLLALATPVHAEALRPKLLFEIESIDDDYILGVVGAVARGPAGEICLLDRQLLDIKIFDAEGDYLRTISRSGEGPGELSSPGKLMLLGDGSLLVPCRMPRRLVRMDLEGIPGREFPSPQKLRIESGFLDFVGRCGDYLLACEDERERDGNRETIRFRWVGFSENDAKVHVLGESSVERRLGEHTVYTSASFPFGRFAAHPRGGIFLATERERYRIQRFDARLQSIGWIEYDYPIHRKTDAELQEEKQHLREIAGDEGDVSLPEILKTKASIDAVIARPGGWLYVRSGRASDQARQASVLGSYDSFDEAGGFAGSFDLDLQFDYEHDQLHWMDRLLVVVRNGMDAMRASQAQFLAEEEREKALSGDWEQVVQIYELPLELQLTDGNSAGEG